MSYKDYYKIMGLKKDASEKDIKTAYRRLARKYHPDISKEADAEEKFKELGEAYEALKDPEKRKVYDQYVHDYNARGSGQGSSERWSFGGERHEQYDFGPDFFETLFGVHPFQNQVRPGTDYQSRLRITLEEAYRGVVKEIQLPIRSASSGLKTIRVNIPAGVISGQKIRLAGQGGASRGGGQPGDLYLDIEVNQHPLFDVKSRDIYLTVPIAPWEAALGATVSVPTLGGNVDLKIPAGSQGGQTLRLKKRGLPGKTQGDQYVILKIIIPQPNTDSAKNFYRKMADEMPFDPRDKLFTS